MENILSNKWKAPTHWLFFLKSPKAFSLIEILLVLFILAFVFAFVSQRFSRRDQKINRAFDKLVRLNRRLVTLSKLHNQTYRWVIQLDSEGPEKYWVEKKQEGKRGEQSPDLLKWPTEAQEKENQSLSQDLDFAVDNSFYSEPEIITPFLEITKVESSQWKEDKTEGLVYIYYYPKGLAQEAAIQFFRPDNQGSWTLYLDSVTKNLQIFKKEKSLAK